MGLTFVNWVFVTFHVCIHPSSLCWIVVNDDLECLLSNCCRLLCYHFLKLLLHWGVNAFATRLKSLFTQTQSFLCLAHWSIYLYAFSMLFFYEFDGGQCMNGLLPPYKKVLCWIFIHVLFLTKWFPKTRMPESQFSCRPRIFIEVNWGWTFLVWAYSWSQNKILASPRTTQT